MKATRFLIAAPVLLAGIALALYGVFALIYREGGGQSYVKLFGHDIDADVAGSISLVLALAAIGSALLLLRRRRRET